MGRAWRKKNANVMESVMNAENITQNQNVKDHVNERKRDYWEDA